MGEHEEPIPSELVNLKEVYERRYLRRKEVVDKMNQEAMDSLTPLIDDHKKAVRAYEDHFDDGLLKYGRDPNKMPFDDRDPAEVKIARTLKRAVEDAESAVRRKEQDLSNSLKESSEFKTLKKAREDFEDWLAGVCAHLKCCASDLDWQARVVKQSAAEKTEIPAALLAIPQD